MGTHRSALSLQLGRVVADLDTPFSFKFPLIELGEHIFRRPLSSLASLPSSPLMGSNGSTSKRQRGIDGDGVGGYYHEVLLPPSKDAAKGGSGVEALNGAVEHIAAAVASKVETSVGEVVDRATVQLKKNVGRVFDKAQQEAEAHGQIEGRGSGAREAPRRSLTRHPAPRPRHNAAVIRQGGLQGLHGEQGVAGALDDATICVAVCEWWC